MFGKKLKPSALRSLPVGEFEKLPPIAINRFEIAFREGREARAAVEADTPPVAISTRIRFR